jgi:DNA-binding transcriptional LysR family regulator
MHNIRHLELFYYVARYRGISQAIPFLPYKLTQPTISRQLQQLEASLGCRLFFRHPFQLTPQGTKVYAHLRLTLENLGQVLDELNGPSPRLVRIASTPLILREYFSSILISLRQKYPAALFFMLEGSQREIDHWFDSQEADIVIKVLEGNPPPGCRAQALLKVPLVLLVPQQSPVRSLRDLLAMDPRTVRLLGPPLHDPIMAAFRAGLTHWPLGWTMAIQANSLELIETCAKIGHGIGVSLLVPGRPLPPRVRAVSLPGFPELRIGLLWRGPRDHVIESILHETKKRVKDLSFGSDL